MFDEAREAPAAVARLMAADLAAYSSLGEQLRADPPRSALTVARGSSDHAAHYMAYLVMARPGRLVTSLPMSLITLIRFFREGGARTVAVVNDAGSPLAEAAQWVLPLHAGAETSVAATKSYIAQLVAGARIVAHWQNDKALLAALETLPEVLERAAYTDWSPLVEALVDADKLFVIGRGTSLAIAMEAALKFKEVCGIQAEAFSGAEVKHGPMALVEEGYPLLIFAPRGPAQAGLLALAEDMRRRGARVLVAAPVGTPGAELPLVVAGHEDLDPISAIQSYYLAVEALARAKGLDPDKPRHLNKVTLTH